MDRDSNSRTCSKAGSKVIPIETYLSRTRKWRRSRLISEIPVQIKNGEPPTFTGGYFHWFTRDYMNVVAYDPSLLDEEDGDYHGGLVLTKKKHVVEVIKIPEPYGSYIIWRSDNGQTMWYGNFGLGDNGAVVFRKRDDSDDWACISRVGVNAMMDIIGITEKDKENEVALNCLNNEGMFEERDMVYMTAFIPWDPKLVMVRHWDRIYVYDCIQKKLDHEVVLAGDRHYSDNMWEWYPYFHSLTNSETGLPSCESGFS